MTKEKQQEADTIIHIQDHAVRSLDNSNSSRPRPSQQHWMMQHVWKCGGTELCKTFRSNGWHVPPKAGCSVFLWPTQGWPGEDYELIGNEKPIPYKFKQKEQLVREYKWEQLHRKTDDGIEPLHVKNVRWLTILRHPYARSLSHYHHMKRDAKPSLKMIDFFTNYTFKYIRFDNFIPDQQVRWHCGTDCSKVEKLLPEHLQSAINNLNQFDVVLILEDVANPDSCSGIQLRHVMNITGPVETKLRRSGSKWYESVSPSLSRFGTSQAKQHQMETPDVMATLGLHNSMDLQFYGYAKSRCEQLAREILERNTKHNDSVVNEDGRNQPAQGALVGNSIILPGRSSLPPCKVDSILDDPYLVMTSNTRDNIQYRQYRWTIVFFLISMLFLLMTSATSRKRRRRKPPSARV